MELRCSKKAEELLYSLKRKYGEILLYQTFGCCDGSGLVCYTKDDFQLGESDICIGENETIKLFTHKNQAQFYRDAEVILIDIQHQKGNEYSLEYESGKSFILGKTNCPVTKEHG